MFALTFEMAGNQLNAYTPKGDSVGHIKIIAGGHLFAPHINGFSPTLGLQTDMVSAKLVLVRRASGWGRTF